MSTYRAWNDEEYPWPPPDGWYEDGDARWWPEGYGPGPASPETDPTVAMPVPEAAPVEAPAPAPAPPAGFDAPAPAPAPAPPPDFGSPAPPSTTPAPPPDFAPPSVSSAPPGMTPPAMAPPGVVAPGSDPWSQPQTVATSTGGSNAKLLAGIGAVAVLALVGLGAYLLLGDSDDGPEELSGPVVFNSADPAGSVGNPHGTDELVKLFYDDDGTATEWAVEVLESPDPAAAQIAALVRVDYVAGEAVNNLDVLNFAVQFADGDRNDAVECTEKQGLALVQPMSPGASAQAFICFDGPVGQLTDASMMISADDVTGQIFVRLQ